MAFSSGKYYPEIAAGKVFIGSTAAAGTTVPLATGTAMTFGLWNTNPNKNAVLLRFTGGFTSGTIALGVFGLVRIYGAFAVATGNNITAFTDGVFGTTIHSGVIGEGSGSTMRFTPSAATVVGNVAALWLNAGHEGATGVGPSTGIDYDFDGVIVAPGNAVFIAGSIAQTALFSMSLMWAEIDR